MTQNILITGDIMLGRLVDECVLGNNKLSPTYVWGDTLPYLKKADFSLINLECVISQKGEKWQPGIKAFHFRARPWAIEVLRSAKIDFVSLANNHVLDYGQEALIECFELLRKNGTIYAGAGRNLTEASKPVFMENELLKIGVISLTDNEPEWEAEEDKPGINYINYDRKGLKQPYYSRIKKAILKAKKKANIVIVAAHVGPNWGEPSQEIKALTHQLIDLGTDLYWGHSNHTTQGIEIYKGKPILYSTGDFIDDYAVDPYERNDLSFLFEVIAEDKKIKKILLRPVKIENFQVNLVKGKDAGWAGEWMIKCCQEFSTEFAISEKTLHLEL